MCVEEFSGSQIPHGVCTCCLSTADPSHKQEPICRNKNARPKRAGQPSGITKTKLILIFKILKRIVAFSTACFYKKQAIVSPDIVSKYTAIQINCLLIGLRGSGIIHKCLPVNAMCASVFPLNRSRSCICGGDDYVNHVTLWGFFKIIHKEVHLMAEHMSKSNAFSNNKSHKGNAQCIQL